MPDNFTMNLEEDKDRICKIFSKYFETHTISEWKYEAALKTSIDQQLVVEPTINNKLLNTARRTIDYLDRDILKRLCQEQEEL
ncbi:hypothetical protein MFLAVUS_006234 [Mucor flavus]|uniref:Uncharacterized protein n=1 Tax=Mucor flavus TaxID=439312 RepID=A0ABP9Z113_9FUNG